jgi:hypothetical protein
MACERCVAGEAPGAASLDQQAGGDQVADAQEREELRRHWAHQGGNLCPQSHLLASDLADADEQPAADPHLHALLVAAKALGEAAASRFAVEGAGERLEAAVEVVQEPTQRELAAVRSETRSSPVVDQELQLTQLRVVGGARQVGSRRAARAMANASIESDLP